MSAMKFTPTLIIFDFDGVLTDNRVLVFEDGCEAVFCNRSDGLAFDLFRRYNIPTLILSTERHPIVGARAAKLQTPVLQGVGNKHDAVVKHCTAQGIDLHRVLYVGNDLNDLAAMRTVGYRVCPADAHPAIREICDLVLQRRGGEGVAWEMAESVLGLKYE